ncbi:hypothetical protein ACE1TI_01585 [Alteribacillus sp. JSM 102045]|uniref:hypothetical protein n=1 Tax=Alteribacillus sp. JSM 102045 TaxID=1562101 RepID=UPI0035C0B507
MIKGLAAFIFLLAGTGHVFLEDVSALEVLEIREDAAVPAAKMKGIQKDDWTLQYKIKNNDLYLECVIPDFSLAKEEKGGDGYLLVQMNGQEAAKMNQAAFIMKSLPSGKHKIEIQPVSYEGEAKAETITFEVEIAEF